LFERKSSKDCIPTGKFCRAIIKIFFAKVLFYFGLAKLLFLDWKKRRIFVVLLEIYYCFDKIKNHRMDNLISYITIHPEIRFGKPCIKGTRIAVVDILQWLASGMTNQEILKDYPSLEEIHIRAALAFAANREKFIKTIIAA
jgi:uncharacterized protein (DUF433 family)